MENKMETKNLLVSLFTIALALFLVANVSAVNTLTVNETVSVNGIEVYDNGTNGVDVSLVAGEYVTVKVYFTAVEDDTDVTVEVELEGEKVKSNAITRVFDVIANNTYMKTLELYVPYELRDQISDGLLLNIEIDGKNYKSILDTISLTVQRPSYNVVVKSITTPSIIKAGESFPVDIVLKNLGYNNLDDVYVSARIAELNIAQGPKWMGDLVYLENCTTGCDQEDTVQGRLSLDVPYNVKPGTYTLEVLVQNDDTQTLESRSILIENDFSAEVVATSTSATVAEDEEAVFEFLLVNPTSNVKVYKISTDGNVSAEVESIVAVPAGSSKTIKLVASAEEQGDYQFTVTVLSGDELVDTIDYQLKVEGNQSNSIVILTVILAIVFLVLLVVLIVLLTKKPEKSEDFGESYY
jgi:hypothetical protein